MRLQLRLRLAPLWPRLAASLMLPLDLAVGGLNHSNLSEFNADMKAISTGLTNLVNDPTALCGN